MDGTPKATKPKARDAKTKIAQNRMSVLELAKELGNVAEACRQRGMDRTSFYEWKRRFQTHGFEGLKDLPPIHKAHPQTTSPETVERIKALALEHPAYGCNRFEAMLALEGVRVSSIIIQKILNGRQRGATGSSPLATAWARATTAGWRSRKPMRARPSRSLPNRPPSSRSRTRASGKDTWNQALPASYFLRTRSSSTR
ncbi:integrase, catalytic region [Rhodovulum sulfidophilum]|uniref:Integrase, catalytic region n=1 Tax=Rhodovulum sulfidophilum TaxID=35806 RepID=A0A0D6B2A8_RHOSU|nr:integrase, catalytic region [Rhodovulum sulfidophilum]